MNELNILVKRCLAHGVVISPYQQSAVMYKYEVYTIPDQVLNVLPKEDLEKYVKGLYLSSCEMAGDWSRGHEMLMSLGFKEVTRKEGHRSFVRLVFDAQS